MAGVNATGYNRGVHKHLRRLDRVWIDQPIYFVTTRTHGRKMILKSEPLVQVLIKEWRDARARHGWVIGRYVIMPDHVHFFCASEPDSKPISTFVGFWKEWTSKGIKCLTKTPGPVWQEQLFDHVLDPAKATRKNGITFAIILFELVWWRTPPNGPGKVKLKSCDCSRRR